MGNSNVGQVQHSIASGVWTIKISNYLDDEVVLPKPPAAGISLVRLNLGELTHMNSVGIKNWMDWLQHLGALDPKPEVEFEDLPLVFVRMTENISGILPENSQIRSFYISYFCPTCGEPENQLHQATEDLTTALSPGGAPLCSACNVSLELELEAETYTQLGRGFTANRK